MVAITPLVSAQSFKKTWDYTKTANYLQAFFTGLTINHIYSLKWVENGEEVKIVLVYD